MDGPLPGMFSDPEAGSQALLRELLASARKLPPVQKCLVQKVLWYRESLNDHFPRLDQHQSDSNLEVDSAYTQNCYHCGRDGGHLMGLPFECNLCSFRNMVGRDLVDLDTQEKFTLMTIRRILLNVMRGLEPDTVASNWSRSQRDFNGCQKLKPGLCHHHTCLGKQNGG
jgi:hypothetical protein